MQIFSKLVCAAICALAAAILLSAPIQARDSGVGHAMPIVANPVAGNPYLDNRVHKVGNVGLNVTNYGMFGTQMDPSIRDPETGLPAPSCQFPYGSGLEYLFQGALWIGAIVDGDTLVSTGHDGWLQVFEMYPDSYPQGGIVKKSTRPTDPAYSPDAVSDADYIATYYDTLTDPAWVAIDDYDGRPHIPLGLKIVQRSYSWSASDYEDFIIFKYQLTNIGTHNLQKMFCGLYYDCDVYRPEAWSQGYADDISGSRLIPDPEWNDSIFIGWSADNQGDNWPYDSWDYRSVRGVFGASLLNYPAVPNLGFNWWVSNEDAFYDWGPVRLENRRDMLTGGLGTPAGDHNKYFFMQNRETDYDQLFSAVDHSSHGWLPPHPVAASNLADGYDTRFLLSFGSVDLAPGDSMEFAFVVALGEDFHRNPPDFDLLFDEHNPQAFYDSLDFSDLTTNVLAARSLWRCINGTFYGDADADCHVDISDAVFLVDYIFNGGPAPSKPKLADVNGDCEINLADIVYLINYIFGGGAAPLEGCAL